MADFPSFDQTTAVDVAPPSVAPGMQSAAPSELPSFDQTEPSDADKHSTPSQQALTGVEGLARTMTGGASDAVFKGARALAEKYSDDPDFWAPKTEDITAREEQNPTISKGSELAGVGAGFLTGSGMPGLIAKGAKAAVGAMGLGAAGVVAPTAVQIMSKIGAAGVTGAIETGLLQGGDEISKAMLGQQDGDPEAAVASALTDMGAAALMGGAGGSALELGGQSLKAIARSKTAGKAADWLASFGTRWQQRAAEAHGAVEEVVKDNSSGAKAADYIYNGGVRKVTEKILSTAGGIPGAVLAHTVGPLLEKVVGKQLGKGSTYATSAILKALSSGETEGLNQVLDYGSRVDKGAKSITNGVDALFKASRQWVIDDVISDKDREKLRDYIENGGVNQEFQNYESEEPEQYAKGGAVKPPKMDSDKPDPVAHHFPAQNMLLNAAKGRISNYLTSVKPTKHPTKLPFDPEPHTKPAERMYDRALDIANKPMSIMRHVKDGTLKLEDLKHFSNMYPELHNHLNKKITERIMNAQLDDERPSYKTLQSMSLFLGAPLDSTMTPSSIMAAQAVFLIPKMQAQQTQQGQQPQSTGKKSTNSLSKGPKAYRTPGQAAESDRTNRE